MADLQSRVANAFRAALERADDHTIADRMGEHEEMDELLAEMRSLTPDGFAFTQRGAFLLEVEGCLNARRSPCSLTRERRASMNWPS